MSETVVLGSRDIEIRDVVAVAREGARVVVADEVSRRLERAREVVERHEGEGRAVYGLTRGLGARVVETIDERERDGYSEAVIRARAVGGGGHAPSDIVRAALFARAAALARGGAGVRPIVLETQVAMLNARLHPVLPEIGSYGASDLLLMANLALPVIGEGRAELGGTVMPGGEAMRRAGIAPLRLASKEGLALCSANSVSTGEGALVLADAEAILDLLEGACALTFEAFRANLSPIDPRIAAARAAPGQEVSAARLRRLLAGSALFDAAEPRRVQDPISLRCASQVHGSLIAGVEFAKAAILPELNGAGDNPLVLAEDGEMLSTGNFHTPATAVAFDALALALSQAASLSAMRTSRMMNGKLTELPDRLSTHNNTRSGMALLGLTAHTLVKEIRHQAMPASLDDAGGYDVEDHAPMTPLAVRHCRRILEMMPEIVACELLASAQALELRAPPRSAKVAAALLRLVRSVSPRFDDDRPLAPDLERVAQLVRSGAVRREIWDTAAA